MPSKKAGAVAAAKKVPSIRITTARLKAALEVCLEMTGREEVLELEHAEQQLTLMAWGEEGRNVRIHGLAQESVGKFPRSYLRVGSLRDALKGAPEWVTLEDAQDGVRVLRPGSPTVKLSKVVGWTPPKALRLGPIAQRLEFNSYDLEWPLAYVDQAAGVDVMQPTTCGVAWRAGRVSATDGKSRAFVAAIPGSLTATGGEGDVMPSAMAQAFVTSINAFGLEMGDKVQAGFGENTFELSWVKGTLSCTLTAAALGIGPSLTDVIPTGKDRLMVAVAPEVFSKALVEAGAVWAKAPKEGRRFLLCVETSRITLKVIEKSGGKAPPLFMQAVPANGAPGSFTVACDPGALEEAIDLPEDAAVLSFAGHRQSVEPFMVHQPGGLARFAVVIPQLAAERRDLDTFKPTVAVEKAPRKPRKAKEPVVTVMAKHGAVVSDVPPVQVTRTESPVQQGLALDGGQGVQAQQILTAAVQISEAVAGLTRRLTKNHR